MTNQEKLQKFIKDNKLSFSTGSDSSLNSDCTILAGYSLYIGAEENEFIAAMEEKTGINHLDRPYNERFSIDIVWECADRNNYGSFWNTEEAQEQYEYELEVEE